MDAAAAGAAKMTLSGAIIDTIGAAASEMAALLGPVLVTMLGYACPGSPREVRRSPGQALSSETRSSC